MGVSRALAFLEELGLGALVTRTRATKVELHCPAVEHDDRRPSAVTFEDSLVTSCRACGRKWSPWSLAVERGLSRRDAVELCIRFGVREERRPDTPSSRRPFRAPTVQRAPEPLAPSPLPADVAERLDAELAARVPARRLHDLELERLRGFDPRLLDALGVGFGRADELPGFGRYPAGTVERVLVPIRDASGRLVSAVSFVPAPGVVLADERVRKSAVPRDAGRFPFLARAIEPAAPGVLLVVEGEPDALAAASVGLDAISVPGLSGAARHALAIAATARAFSAHSVWLVPDGDDASRASFRELGVELERLDVSTRTAAMVDDRDLGDVVLAALASVCGVPATPTDRVYVGRRVLELLEPEEGRRS
jgi:hypothetical protein